ncbi:hypothetical protein [Coleofasciculus chthonoplastes]|uniref:hypothetical protein n=1 Tax=Coleofasciculus chthonoplastes TaxID=64178 RepID=UPI0032FB1A9E
MALKSKAISTNWERVSGIFENSLRSAYNQIDPDFRIVVVCHETPKLQHSYDERVEIINVGFPPPTQVNTNLTMQDKWRKLAVGMIRVGELCPDFVMIMDADDLVNRRLAHYANTNLEANGWIFKQGYRYKYGSQWIYWDNNFNCGTNAIVNSKLIKFPQNIDNRMIDECVILRNGHTIIEEKLEALETPLMPLPFPGAIYVYGHGDNDSAYNQTRRWHGFRYFLGKLRRIRPLSNQIKKEFSVII